MPQICIYKTISCFFAIFLALCGGVVTSCTLCWPMVGSHLLVFSIASEELEQNGHYVAKG